MPRILSFLFVLLLAACGQQQVAQGPGNFDERTQALVDAARAEGMVSVYSSLPVDVMAELTAAFQAKYGVRAEVWRGGSEEILQRTVAEARAGRNAVDVVETAAAEVEAIARERLLMPVDSPVHAQLIPEATLAGRPWTASRLIVFVTAYNTNLIAPAEAPRTFQDLLDPKWKGRLTVEANDFNWLMGVSDVMGEDAALSLLRNIVAANGISMRDGHGLLTNLIVSGEVALTFTQYYEQAAHARDEGAPIGLAYLSPVIAVPTGLGVLAGAPHPNAAHLFYDFYLTDGQAVLAKFDYVTANLNYRAHMPPDLDLYVTDMAKFIDQYDKWRALHREIFAAGAPR